MRLLTSSSTGHTLSVRSRFRYGVTTWEFVVGSKAAESDSRLETVYTRDEARRLHRDLGYMLRATAPPKKKKAA